tara:strand:- start:358 stop:819 length:462 start_codon:yes stop_codon:yes gene_type:complete
MRKASLDVCIQFIGLLSVVAGLLFVGMEMRQTQRIALASETSNRMYLVLIQTINSSSETGVDWTKMVFGDYSELSESEKIAKRNNVAMGWLVAENDFSLFKLGLMSEEVMEVNEGLLSLYYNQCDVRDIYEARRHLMDVEFVQIVESQSDPCD